MAYSKAILSHKKKKQKKPLFKSLKNQEMEAVKPQRGKIPISSLQEIRPWRERLKTVPSILLNVYGQAHGVSPGSERAKDQNSGASIIRLPSSSSQGIHPGYRTPIWQGLMKAARGRRENLLEDTSETPNEFMQVLSEKKPQAGTGGPEWKRTPATGGH